jgi:hypothetical protein
MSVLLEELKRLHGEFYTDACVKIEVLRVHIPEKGYLFILISTSDSRAIARCGTYRQAFQTCTKVSCSCLVKGRGQLKEEQTHPMCRNLLSRSASGLAAHCVTNSRQEV